MQAIDASADDGLDDDPHASKISPDDPRLKIERPRSRVLRTKLVVAAVAVLVGMGAWAVISSAGREKKVASAQEAVKVPERPPVVPAFIQQAPAGPEPGRPRSAVSPGSAFASPPSRPAFGQSAHPDPYEQQRLQEAARLAELEEQARTSALFFESAAPRSSNASPAAAAGAMPLQPAPAASATGSPALAGQNLADVWDPNLQGRKNAFLEDPKDHPDYLSTALQPSLSPYELKATAIIPATLITGINSDLPGPIIAQVREQVYDTVTGQHLLIPQGARLLASYDSMVAWGQQRVLLCWQRLIFPNGKSINLQCMPAADLKGQAGLTDEVNEHWDRLIAAVGLSTVLSLGTQAAAGDPSGYQLSITQSAARNAAQQFNAAGQGVVQRQLNIQPTITVRPGFGVNVIVTKDMVLEPYAY